MRQIVVGIVLWAALGMGVAAGADDPIIAPIQKFMDAFNKGDTATAAATHSATADLTIIDEVPPYAWHGVKAFGTWAEALGVYDKSQGITDEHVAISAPTRVETSGDRAYVIVPAVYTFKEHGEARRAEAQMTLALRKGASGWLIHAWTWTGPRATAVK
jgi:ketosteroid isomerase-like protein